MQGLVPFIPTETKIKYLNQLLKVGFDVLDFGSFVSPKAIPQMQDTAEVIQALEVTNSSTELLAIVVNEKGAIEALKYPQISYLGYPFSISETFQIRNTNRTISESLPLVKLMHNQCKEHDKKLVVYLSMAFGNPYEDPWSYEILTNFAQRIVDLGVSIISLADTVGSADSQDIYHLFTLLNSANPDIEWGAHFHATSTNWHSKLEAAWAGGCRRFDSAMLGFGGCPMAKEELVGNIATENLLLFLEQQAIPHSINQAALSESLTIANQIFHS